MSMNISNEADQVRITELEQRLSEAQITKHSGDCRWWSYRICDCGYLMRANSGDFGEPSEQVTKDWLEHSANCQQVKDTPLVQILKRDKKPEWVQDLEGRLEFAARELRYMADSFTLKSNFMPSELRIKELEAEAAALRGVLHLAKEMTRAGYHANPYHGLEHTHFDLHAAIDNALSSSAGKALIDRLERLQDALDKAVRIMEGISSHGYTITRQNELNAQLPALAEALKAKDGK